MGPYWSHNGSIMVIYWSLLVIMRPYVSLWVLIGPYPSLQILLGLYASLCFLKSSNGSMKVAIRPYGISRVRIGP